MKVILDHSVCEVCETVRNNRITIPEGWGFGMEAGVHPYPVTMTAEAAKEFSRGSWCGGCDQLAPRRLALRPAGDEA